MTYLTKKQLEIIARQLAALSVKDSDLENAQEIKPDDIVAIVQDGINKKLSVDFFRDELQNGPRGLSAYEVAVKNGYTGSETEWLNDPINGAKGNGIESIEVVGEYSSADSTENTYRINPYVGAPFEFKVKNGKGIASVVQTTTSQESDGTNVITITFSDGSTATFQTKNGGRGNSGYTGAAGELEVVNSLDADDPETDAAKALSAYQGNRLKEKVEGMITDNQHEDFSISDPNGSAIVIFKDGEIKTRKFDSALIPDEGYTDAGDLAISDKNGNILVLFKNGHIQTKNFDSSEVASDLYIKSVIRRYAGKRLSILGDSISTFGDPSSTNQNGTYCYSYYPAASCRYSQDGVDSIVFEVNNTYWMKLIYATGMSLGVNDSYRGTRVSGVSNAFNLQSRINHLGENGTPDVILVYGGTNDAGGNVELGTFNTDNPANYSDSEIASLPVTTFADAYRTMLIRLMKTYPSAEIVVILPTFTTSYYTITNLDLYVEIIKEACDFFGIKYIDARCTGINVYNKASYLVDGIHPNVAGMDLLFKKIYRQLIFN